ncbi:tetratricopeptide repeat protein [Spirosoma endbachense]|uniref:Tetratricopeptide repeat protein n=1 Tax=Spirosoma endbachense TaxID=2666025 RepID=A0A6P1VQW0_9BACT|nr:tetratricopeptide repeat protein [Spirosoma endbachense]QHV94370.1 tetratricopeptide repeat protein [Spirosoma endbachense]
MLKFYFLPILFLCVAGNLSAQQAGDTKAAQTLLEQTRTLVRGQLRQSTTGRAAILKRMFDLGLWQEATDALKTGKGLINAEKSLLWAEYHWLTNDFQQAEKDVKSALASDKNNSWAKRSKALLAIEAWDLQNAEKQCKAMLASNPNDEETSVVLGRALLLQKKYPEALTVAKKLQNKNPKLAAAYLLEANVYFWDQHPEQAEAPLVKSLTLDPLNADARFSYGYAIWRRIDATQLNDMAAQWQLALAINPLHFQTHWHWGNGHTNLTYADYADKDEKEIREKLKEVDKLFRANRLADAVAITRQVEQQYPSSVLPAMHRASIYYSDFDSPNRKANLDSAEQIFTTILDRKKHYGPAHNGLSAVIKSKRIPYLMTYDSITTVLKTTKINDPENFANVFPDLSYYSGNRAKAMVWNQMYTSVVYFPFLSKQGNAFVVPPLHIDLAIAMRSPYFRFTTTFDNRQWMDIRGVGSGAAAIEYVERGAYEERNVVLHEYVHLFHGRVLTDAENRQIRERYYHAMKNKLTLDYYSQNNESEYFAQTYPAYFESMKVHPLDFKSMNITAELKAKDPEMYKFLDALVKKERAYLNGNKAVMASNWAQVYINLSNKVIKSDSVAAAKYLDTALVYDSKYQPAYLAYARLKQQQKDFEKALSYIKAAETIDPGYAPVYAAYSQLEEAKYTPDKSRDELIKTQAGWLQKALDLEKDFQTRASVAIQLRDMYFQNGRISQAIKAAEDYAANGPDVSTYLRDRRDDAKAFAAAQRGMLGYANQLDVLKKLVLQRPQNYELRGLYADALLANGRYQECIETMKQVQRILEAGKNGRTDFDLRIAESYAKLNKQDSLTYYLDKVKAEKTELTAIDKQRLVRLFALAKRVPEAEALFTSLPAKGTLIYQSAAFQSNGHIQALNGKSDDAITNFKKSLEYNPYNLDSYVGLASLYKQAGKQAELKGLMAAANQLDIKPGEIAGL